MNGVRTHPLALAGDALFRPAFLASVITSITTFGL